MKFVALSLLSLLAMTLHGMAREPVAPQKSQMVAKLQLKLPQDHLKQATLDEAVDLLRFHALKLDPKSEGLNLLILQTNQVGSRVIKSLNLRFVPLSDTLHTSAKPPTPALISGDGPSSFFPKNDPGQQGIRIARPANLFSRRVDFHHPPPKEYPGATLFSCRRGHCGLDTEHPAKRALSSPWLSSNPSTGSSSERSS